MKKIIFGILVLPIVSLAMQKPERVYNPAKTQELIAAFDPEELIFPCFFSVEKVRELILAGADPNVKVGGEGYYRERSVMYFLIRGLYHYSTYGEGISDQGMIAFLFENNYKLDNDAFKFAQESYPACLPTLTLHAKDITEK